MSSNMDVHNPEEGPAQVGKKRKRTGKERAERKAAAILAREQAEAALESGEVVEEAGKTVTGTSDNVLQERPVVDLELLAKRVPTALKHLHPTFKQARSFEVRRLVKKVKFLRTKPNSAEEVKDLEAQLALLTHVVLDPVIKSHLLLRLRKHPRTKQVELPSQVVQALTVAPSASSSTSAVLLVKVENRLCSSKIVADAVKATVVWVTGEEGARLPSKTGPAPRAGEVSKQEQETSGPSKSVKSSVDHVGDEDEDADDNGADSEFAVEGDGLNGSRMQVLGSDEELDGEDDEDDEAADAAGWESGSVADELGDEELASGSDEESDDGDSDAIPLPPAPKAKRQKESSPAPKKKPKSAATTAVTSSMFLPSLSTGFTLGDSDSDPDLDDDIDGAGVIGNKKAVRKNRRGQRARQAIWEKKYGRGAKHVVKAREEEQKVLQAKAERQAKRAERLGVDPAALRGRGRGRGRGGVSFGTRGGSQHFGPQAQADGGVNANSIPVTERRPMAAAPVPPAAQIGQKALHPSWEAAKLRKQKEISSAPKATKIVFD